MEKSFHREKSIFGENRFPSFNPFLVTQLLYVQIFFGSDISPTDRTELMILTETKIIVAFSNQNNYDKFSNDLKLFLQTFHSADLKHT